MVVRRMFRGAQKYVEFFASALLRKMNTGVSPIWNITDVSFYSLCWNHIICLPNTVGYLRKVILGKPLSKQRKRKDDWDFVKPKPRNGMTENWFKQISVVWTCLLNLFHNMQWEVVINGPYLWRERKAWIIPWATHTIFK